MMKYGKVGLNEKGFLYSCLDLPQTLSSVFRTLKRAHNQVDGEDKFYNKEKHSARLFGRELRSIRAHTDNKIEADLLMY